MDYANCIIFALLLYFRRKHKDSHGYLILRRSHWGPFPHLMYGRRRKDGTLAVVGYRPLHAQPSRIPKIFFRGEAHWGDPKPARYPDASKASSKSDY